MIMNTWIKTYTWHSLHRFEDANADKKQVVLCINIVLFQLIFLPDECRKSEVQIFQSP